MKDLINIKYWLFDLDNTLYSGNTKVFDQVDKRMSKYISNKLNVSVEEARKIQKNYFHEYNTTLNGMIKNHEINAQEFLDLDLEAKAGRDLRAAARKEQEDAVREIGANIDYIYKAFNDQEGLSNGNTGVMHAVKALDDARRRARGLKLNPGGGNFAYKDFIIIPNSQPLSEPENISPYGYKNDSNFVKNSNLEYKIINQSDFMKADLEKRMKNRNK